MQAAGKMIVIKSIIWYELFCFQGTIKLRNDILLTIFSRKDHNKYFACATDISLLTC